jgi:hypothetical protein
MASTPSPEKVRLTISVTPEVHAAFVRLSEAGSMSISRAMGDWLGDTLDAVQFTAQKMEEARAAPKRVMRELHAYALGLSDETGALLQTMRKPAAGPAPAESVARPSPARSLPPRPVIRGGKSPDKPSSTGGKAHG